MNDKFGNPLTDGCLVLYFSSSYNHTVHVGRVFIGENLTLISEKGNPIIRPSWALILYNGVLPDGNRC